MSQAPEAKSAGLPMTSKWDPAQLERDQQTLIDLDRQPLLPRLRGYFKLTGPAWMQSAMTLGAGSAAASVVAGAFYGYQLLWVQPIAMFLGVCMMMALGNITLTKGERAYLIVGRELHVSIAFLWALATVVSTVIWHFGQYALLGGAVWDLANVAGFRNPVDPATGEPTSRALETAVRFAGGFLILGINIVLVWSYGSKPRGIRLYETFLRWMIRLVMLAFLVVVIAQVARSRVDFSGILRGFTAFQIPDQPGAATTILGAIGAAVGINMTFLYPYSILAKGWGPHHKGLSRFDLVMSLFVPYVILTSLIIVGMASTVHDTAAGFGTTLANNPAIAAFKPIDAAQALSGVWGSSLGRIVFDLGFMGMACGAISAHMVCVGFTVCEMFGLEYTPRRYRMFTLVPAIGVLGVMIKSPIWLPVLASAIAFTMLPIAYLVFFILNNKRRYLGDAVGRGWRRAVFNAILLVALAMALIGSGIQIKNKVLNKLFPPPAEPAARTVQQ
ncbi:MAG: divalent metal cation transporter [Verrucomicrobiales bacterium]|nr:divalent metal cation transporter [Verrucomicrobiales bacterium]MCP5526121.1 divalent metal cation transporter [Verrucomicrobiales bacterium]